MYYCSRGPTFTIVVEAPRFAHQVGRKLRGLLSRWVSLGLNDLRSPPTLSNDSRDKQFVLSDSCNCVLGMIVKLHQQCRYAKSVATSSWLLEATATNPGHD